MRLFWLAAAAWVLLSSAVPLRAAEEMVSLRYTYREDRGQATVFRNVQGETYLSLVDVTAFYGIRVSFAPATGRITLSKGERQVFFALHQPFFLLGDTLESHPMDPAVLVGGQPGLTPASVQDVLRFILNLNVQYVDADSVLVAGGVNAEDLRREVLAAMSTPPAVPLPSPAVAVSPTRVVVLPPATPTPDRLESVPAATPRPTRVVERVKLGPPGAGNVYRVRKVVLDAGHGGRDGGARGLSGKTFEKDATLDIAKRVAEILMDEPGFEVLLTRKKDVYLSLKERTEFANRHDADLFVSVHANANLNRQATGSETYVYSSRASAKVASIAARRENEDMNMMDFIKDDLLHSAFRARSFVLAEAIDQRIRDRLGQRIRRIEQAPFYVLARVRMPSVLIETAFISNAAEERKLRDPEWRARMARAIADGILAYRDQVESSLDARRAQDAKGR